MRRLNLSTFLFVVFLIAQSSTVLAAPQPEGETASSEPSGKPESSEPSGKPESSEPQELPPPLSREEICRMIESTASTAALPLAFFARLIWRESRFDPGAVSPAGAQGIAQFMPKTASGRGLADPFEPFSALRESAEYLSELLRRFGNLGLAAAAYNGGPKRVQDWLAKRGSLRQETHDYVRIITGHSPETWAAAEPPQDADVSRFTETWCTEIANLMAEPRTAPPVQKVAKLAAQTHRETEGKKDPKTQGRKLAEGMRDKAKRGMQLAANWSKATAAAASKRIRNKLAAEAADRRSTKVRNLRGTAAHELRVAANGRANADKPCSAAKGRKPCRAT